jgi:DNA repair exonuclease SbcCD ATPase subunit
MAIVFRSIKWRNFLSTGNEFTQIDLNRSPTTLIVGHNGAGKSTLLDALSFALFGKPHRSINKPQLVNSVNNKNCEVEIEFKIGAHEFKVVRGMKPNKFEIYQNGNMINQSAAAKDYQKYLEQNVLKLNHKSFHQIVVLGSSSFIPFMQLPAHHRREVIEDLLDINIFSKMNVILKERTAKVKEQLNDLEYQINLTKEKISLQRKYLKDIDELNSEQIEYKKDQVKEFKNEIAEYLKENKVCSDYIKSNKKRTEDEMKSLNKRLDSINSYRTNFKSSVITLVKEAKFFEENDQCPTCDQDIAYDFKEQKILHASKKAKELKEAIEKADHEYSETNDLITHLNQTILAITKKQNIIESNNRSIEKIREKIAVIEDEIDSLKEGTDDLNDQRNILNDMLEDQAKLSDRKFSLSEERSYNAVASEMLKDTGIKTKIIKEYLPAMNTLVNQYLQTMDFFVSFNLDENFSETIKSRHRDNFNYASFSEGEKQRIDLSLLFTWRQIAKMKNSTSTNLLVLDETFDSSLDNDGIDNLLKIIRSFDDTQTNVFVISHKGDALDGKFRSKIEFKKDRNFSKMLIT